MSELESRAACKYLDRKILNAQVNVDRDALFLLAVQKAKTCASILNMLIRQRKTSFQSVSICGQDTGQGADLALDLLENEGQICGQVANGHSTQSL